MGGAKCGVRKANIGKWKGRLCGMLRSMQQIKERKKCSESNLEGDCTEHKDKEVRSNCKNIIKESKGQSWKTYGEDLGENSTSSTREFFKAVRSYGQRDDPIDPTSIINNGSPIAHSNEITNRWSGDLLNPGSDWNQQPFQLKFYGEINPLILQKEVQSSMKTIPTNKAAGIYGITTEAKSLWRNRCEVADNDS